MQKTYFSITEHNVSRVWYSMKKQGFSLIELMVVIVIMGVLAAVAVPKLFGQMDKAKAAELGLAAGTYIKMQDTYIHEQHKGGTWQAIGYKSPAGNESGKASTTTFEYDADQGTYNWTASNIVGLNNCTQGKKWFVNFLFEQSPDHAQYWASSDDVANCISSLTPNFTNIGNTATPITSPSSVE